MATSRETYINLPTGSSEDNTTQESSSSQPKRKRLFNRELRYMMHGFGDDVNP